jgi:acyl carrier protein
LVSLVERLLANNSIERSFSVDDKLVDIGLTSIDMVNLLLSVEADFDVEIPQSEITPENFGTIARLELLLTRLEAPG